MRTSQGKDTYERCAELATIYGREGKAGGTVCPAVMLLGVIQGCATQYRSDRSRWKRIYRA